MTEVYVLQGDIEDWDYQTFGVFTSVDKALAKASKVLNDLSNLELEELNDEFDFTGLVINRTTLDEPDSTRLSRVYYDFDKSTAVLND